MRSGAPAAHGSLLANAIDTRLLSRSGPTQGEDKPSPLLWTALARRCVGIVGAMACPRPAAVALAIFQVKLLLHTVDVTYVTVAYACLRLYFEHQVPMHE